MHAEVASFRPDDPDPLVQASFACACCLRQPTLAAVEPSSDDGTGIECHCRPCGRSWTVMLTVEQALRVHLRPPWHGMSTVVYLSGLR